MKSTYPAGVSRSPAGIRFKGRRAELILSLALCLGLWSCAADPADQGGPAPISLEARVDRSEITVGDLVIFTLLIEHDPELTVTTPDPGPALREFEVRNLRPLPEVRESGRVRRGVEYTITTFQTGPVRIPPLPVAFMTADGRADSLETEPIEIDVRSVLPADAEDIMDIRGPVLPPRELRPILLAAAAAVLALVLAAFIYRFIRHRRAGLDVLGPTAAPPRPPFEVAMERLEQIKREGLLGNGRVKEYYSRVADTVRAYLDGRFGIAAMELTTAETLTCFRAISPPGGEPQKILAGLLNVADLVKFARLEPQVDRGIDYMETACRFLELTRPAEASEGEREPQPVEAARG